MNATDDSNITLGVVKSTSDPKQMGRLKIYCPSIDDPSYELTELPWADYCSPFGGAINNFTNPDGTKNDGPTSYGLWAIPKIGARVVVFFLDGDPNNRVWFGCMFPEQSNNTLPAGKNFDNFGAEGPFTDTLNKKPLQESKLKKAGLDLGDFYKSRGGYEKQYSKDPIEDQQSTEGYADNPNSPGILDPQGYGLVTPGGHYISLNDSPEHSRIRAKTRDGNQIILDDTTGFIYFSTDEGNSWSEMTRDGHVYMYGAKSISMKSDVDINMFAANNINMRALNDINVLSDKNINIQSAQESIFMMSNKFINIQSATSDINVKAGGSIFETSAKGFHMKSGAEINTHAASDLNILAGSQIKETGTKINLNSASATSAQPASDSKPALEAPIVPEHEPWDKYKLRVILKK